MGDQNSSIQASNGLLQMVRIGWDTTGYIVSRANVEYILPAGSCVRVRIPGKNITSRAMDRRFCNPFHLSRVGKRVSESSFMIVV